MLKLNMLSLKITPHKYNRFAAGRLQKEFSNKLERLFSKANIERLSVKFINNQFDRTH